MQHAQKYAALSPEGISQSLVRQFEQEKAAAGASGAGAASATPAAKSTNRIIPLFVDYEMLSDVVGKKSVEHFFRFDLTFKLDELCQTVANAVTTITESATVIKVNIEFDNGTIGSFIPSATMTNEKLTKMIEDQHALPIGIIMRLEPQRHIRAIEKEVMFKGLLDGCGTVLNAEFKGSPEKAEADDEADFGTTRSAASGTDY